MVLRWFYVAAWEKNMRALGIMSGTAPDAIDAAISDTADVAWPIAGGRRFDPPLGRAA